MLTVCWIQELIFSIDLSTLFTPELNSTSDFSSCSTSFLLRDDSSFEIFNSCVCMLNLLDNFLSSVFLSPSSTFSWQFVVCSLRDWASRISSPLVGLPIPVSSYFESNEFDWTLLVSSSSSSCSFCNWLCVGSFSCVFSLGVDVSIPFEILLTAGQPPQILSQSP